MSSNRLQAMMRGIGELIVPVVPVSLSRYGSLTVHFELPPLRSRPLSTKGGVGILRVEYKRDAADLSQLTHAGRRLVEDLFAWPGVASLYITANSILVHPYEGLLDDYLDELLPIATKAVRKCVPQPIRFEASPTPDLGHGRRLDVLTRSLDRLRASGKI
jgi:hypothetical protein